MRIRALVATLGLVPLALVATACKSSSKASNAASTPATATTSATGGQAAASTPIKGAGGNLSGGPDKAIALAKVIAAAL
jgi:hypothetical protein